ncbi:MAG: nucleotidyl transferase AbiEii/AbiGii toxin family protein [bacterium]
MITLEEIKKFYSSDLQKFDRGLLREYLQCLILSIIYTSKIGAKLSFLGGTCLRIVYGSKRFSEDLDFDNKNLTEEEFTTLSEYIKKELERYGFEVEITITKTMVLHCKIKFPKILQMNNLSPLESEKILIQVDTFDQKVSYETETYILNKFDITKPIIVTPKNVILSQKLWTITNREKAKGRDFYDISFLLQTTKPDPKFLFDKFNTDNFAGVKKQILEYISNLDFEMLSKEVKPFLLNDDDVNKVRSFKQIFEQAELE